MAAQAIPKIAVRGWRLPFAFLKSGISDKISINDLFFIISPRLQFGICIHTDISHLNWKPINKGHDKTYMMKT